MVKLHGYRYKSRLNFDMKKSARDTYRFGLSYEIEEEPFRFLAEGVARFADSFIFFWTIARGFSSKFHLLLKSLDMSHLSNYLHVSSLLHVTKLLKSI